MGTIWIREFLGGLDARRLAETTQGGVLIEASDCHITRGGEIETRAAFVEAYSLPAGTVGLAATRSGLTVFGSEEQPGGMPVGVAYQRLQDSGGATLLSVPSYDLYSGKIYAASVFDDGSVRHFYDGAEVVDWYDGRTRVSFFVVSGYRDVAIPATGSFTITGGTLGGGNEITSVTVDGVTVTSGAVAHTGDHETTAEDVAANITAHSSTPNYTAIAEGATVYITASQTGPDFNGHVVAANVGGDVTVGSINNMAGGQSSATSTLDSIVINGTPAILSPIEWQGSAASTAEAIADTINSVTTEPNFEAVVVGDRVTILSALAGDDLNDKAVTLTTSNDFTVSPATGLVMEGGSSSDDVFQPGTFVQTIQQKMYALSGPNMHFSGIGVPTGWTTDNIGANFIDVSSWASGSEDLVAIERYNNLVAVFAVASIQTWFIDPDPELYRQVQLLQNTGTFAPRSVTQFGDDDIFYLDESGIRSLRARDSSNAASTSDVGVSVDTLIKAHVQGLSNSEKADIVGLIEPGDKRFWLICKNKIFVLSFFSAERTISAWTTYNLDFDVTDAVIFNKKVWLRSGDKIYVYGGLGSGLSYDDTAAVARLPYLDGESPTQLKFFTGLDAAARGTWKVYAHYSVSNQDAKDKVGVIHDSTFEIDRIRAESSSTHMSFTFESQGVGPHKLGSVIIHYSIDESGKNEG